MPAPVDGPENQQQCSTCSGIDLSRPVVTQEKFEHVFEKPVLSDTIKEALGRYPKEDVVDGCTATAHVAYACCDTTFLYPITPSSSASECMDLWAHQNRLNVFGQKVTVLQLQSEAGASGSVHGAVSLGAITTTFTASQGLLLMIPTMYKIAGELIPCVFHVSARAVAGQALSIFGDHSDVMACRQCGLAMLSSASVQESMDLALVAHMATLKTSIPFIHFFDGFRTSHELQKIEILDYCTISDLLDHKAIARFRSRALSPTHPYLKGTSQGPEVYFQNVEAASPFYAAVPDAVEQAMEDFYQKVGRRYKLFDYLGAPDAEDIIVVLGSAAYTVYEAVTKMMEQGQKVGVLIVRLFRPWNLDRFLEAIPTSVKRICVMDRTKEAGSLGEPLYLDVAASFQRRSVERPGVFIIGGRYGLGSKDFVPAMVFSMFANLRSSSPINNFVVGIEDDVSHNSLDWKHFQPGLDTVPAGTRQCMFWGYGSDGTVSANKNVIKIIGNSTPLFAQGYFAYSAHKAGGLTVSHLRFGPTKITSSYLLLKTDYVACHRDVYVKQYDLLETIDENGTFVLNCPWTDDQLDAELPGELRRQIARRNVKFYTIDANTVAAKAGMGRRINNVLMTVFFQLSGVLPFEQAIALFKKAIEKSYGKKGQHVVEANWKAVDAALEFVHEVHYDKEAWKNASLVAHDKETGQPLSPKKLAKAPLDFVESVMLPLERMKGDDLPVSTFQNWVGGRLPMGTAATEKRAPGLNIPIVDMDKCIQCNHCSFVCPHAAIRPFLMTEDEAEKAPNDFMMKKAKGSPELANYMYRIQVSPLDCTGCELCTVACPEDCLTMVPLDSVRAVEEEHWDYAITLPERGEEVSMSQRGSVKGSQFFAPMFEFSGACAGCGETPYVKLLTQLFGERMVIANATGCSMIFSSSYPSNPYTVNQKGYGPGWGNSLFENNAEYGYGMWAAMEHRRAKVKEIVEAIIADESVLCLAPTQMQAALKQWPANWKKAPVCAEVYETVAREIDLCKEKHPLYAELDVSKNLLVKVTQWIIGGDGWATDIGYGGLDHVIASGADVNILVLDTEAYANTGGQKSKSTAAGAVHKFASGGSVRNKKDLPWLMMQYGDVYVASIASSANFTQSVRALVEAEAYEGPSLVVAYAPCIEMQYIKPFSLQIEHCKLAVESGYWPLYRYNPILEGKGENPFQLDSKKLKADVSELLKRENRFAVLRRSDPALASKFEVQLRDWAESRFKTLQRKALGDTAFEVQTKQDAGDFIHILYGSETGNAEDVSKRVSGMMKTRGIKNKVLQLDEVSPEEVAEMTNIVIICSTAGQGEFPGNAKGFWEELNSSDYSEQKTLFEKVSYAVFGLGDSSYIYFNHCARLFDEKFAELGGKRILPCGKGDDLAEEKYETALAEWLPEYWTETKAPEPCNVSDDPSPSMYYVMPVSETAYQYQQCVPYGCVLTELKVNRRITPEDYDVNVRHLEFDLTGTNFKYALGDSLAIIPHNDPEEVAEFCDYFGFQKDQWVKINKAEEESSLKHDVLFRNPITVGQLFSECLDVFGKPGRSFYELFYKYCTDPAEKEKAKAILQKDNKEELQGWTQKETVTVFDVLKKFPSCKPSIAQFIDLVVPLKPRYYSIASSQKYVGQNNLHLCIGIVEWKDSHGRNRVGQATGYINRSIPTADKRVFVAACLKATAFNLPPSDKHPIIVAGMGTGLAPFRAFVQYRAYLKGLGKEIGPVSVYFGCRYQAKDYLYGEELEQYKKDGVITNLEVAFSRDTERKVYVQHKIYDDPEKLYKALIGNELGGFFYLCGSAKQVPIDVRKAVCWAISQQEGISEEEASEKVLQLQLKGRYNVEAW